MGKVLNNIKKLKNWLIRLTGRKKKMTVEQNKAKELLVDSFSKSELHDLFFGIESTAQTEENLFNTIKKWGVIKKCNFSDLIFYYFIVEDYFDGIEQVITTAITYNTGVSIGQVIFSLPNINGAVINIGKPLKLILVTSGNLVGLAVIRESGICICQDELTMIYQNQVGYILYNNLNFNSLQDIKLNKLEKGHYSKLISDIEQLLIGYSQPKNILYALTNWIRNKWEILILIVVAIMGGSLILIFPDNNLIEYVSYLSGAIFIATLTYLFTKKRFVKQETAIEDKDKQKRRMSK
ncbi:MAG: hypothetical protein HPY60_09185 [Candidatus Methanofastidiosum sp.]|nr:hypothetical protein [Methanofastidiosum sp.]